MATLQTIRDELHALTERVHGLTGRISAVELRQWRFMRAHNASHLNSPISTPTTPISHTKTGTTAPSTEPPIIKHGRRYLPRLLSWLAEQALKYIGPTLLSAALAGWAIIRKYGEQMWAWVADWWIWLLS